MYFQEYCDEPQYGEIVQSGKTYEDSLSEQYENIIRNLDSYIFLMDAYKIIKSCYDDFLQYPEKKKDKVEFWKINKYLLNYLNAVYFYKEFVDDKDSPIKKISNSFYKNKQWYWFLCNFRNSAIHQGIIAREMLKKTGTCYIDLNEMKKIQEKRIEDIKKMISDIENESEKKAKKKNLDSAGYLFNRIKQIEKEESTRFENMPFLNLKVVIEKAQKEIDVMHERNLEMAYYPFIEKPLKELFELIYWDNSTAKYTFLVNHEYMNEGKTLTGVYEPTYSIDNFIQYIFDGVGKIHPVAEKIYNLLKDRGYTYLYEYKCSIDKFFQK